MIAAMPRDMLVSVIMPVHNAERFVRQALDSIGAQTYVHYEIVVVDRPSTDRTAGMVDAYPRTRRLVQVGEGLGAAWNTGLAAAQGDLIAFLDSDDLWTPDKLRLQVDYLAAHPTVDYVIAHVDFFLEPGCPRPAGMLPEVLERSHAGQMPGTLLARRSVFDQIGVFETQYGVTVDIEWFARLKAEAVPGAVLPDVVLHKRVHESNLSSLAGWLEYQRHLPRLLKATLDRRRQRAAQSAAPRQP